MIQKDVDNIHMFKKLGEISVFYPSMYKLIVDISGKIYDTNLELMFCLFCVQSKFFFCTLKQTLSK